MKVKKSTSEDLYTDCIFPAVFLLTRNTKEVSEMEVSEEVIINQSSGLMRIEGSLSEFKREVRSVPQARRWRQGCI